MWRLTVACVLITIGAMVAATPKTNEQLVADVLRQCADMDCVKVNVLNYLDGVAGVSEDARSVQNIDAVIYKRLAKILKTHEFRMRLPEAVFDSSEIVYNPTTGLDVEEAPASESRGLLKKKLLLLPLMLLKLKLKLLMPIFVALIGLKALKALILSKLAILLVVGFIAYQYLGKSGMPMMMSMAPAEPAPMYGAPAATTAPPSSYEPGWEPSQGGPYSRVWSSSGNTASDSNAAQSAAYSAYYPAASSSSTTRP